MSITDVRLQQNPQIVASNADEATDPSVSTVPVGQGSGTSDVSSLPKVVQDSVDKIIKASGLNLSDKQCLQLFSNFGYNLKTLESDEKARKAAEEKVLKTIHYVSTKYINKLPNKQLTFEALNEYTIKYSIQLKSGWDSIDSFERKQYDGNRKSLTERLQTYYPNADLSDPQKRKEYMIKYFQEHFEGLKSKGIDGKDVAVNQLTDFSKLMFNSSPEERVEMVEAIEYLLAENRCPAYKGLLESMVDLAGKQKIADAATTDKQERWFSKTDVRGNRMSEEDAREISAESAKYQSEDVLKDNLDKANQKAEELFTTENKKRYEELKKKYKDLTGKDFNKLSEEDKKLVLAYEFQASFRSGQIAGAAQNETIENITDLLRQMNKDGYEYAQPVYRDILNQIQDYTQAHPELKENFENLINKITGGNYKIAVNDRKNGTTTDFKTPSDSVGSAESDNIGYQINTTPDEINSSRQYINNFALSTFDEDSPKFTVEKAKDNKSSSGLQMNQKSESALVLRARAYTAQSFTEINECLNELNITVHDYIKGVFTDTKPVSKVAEMYAQMKTQSSSFAFKNVLCTFAENNKILADNLRNISGMEQLLAKHNVEE